MTGSGKLSGAYRAALSRGQIELACALQPLLFASHSGKNHPVFIIRSSKMLRLNFILLSYFIFFSDFSLKMSIIDDFYLYDS